MSRATHIPTHAMPTRARAAARAALLSVVALLAACGDGATGPAHTAHQTRVSFIRRPAYGESGRLMIAEIGATDPRTLTPIGEAVGAFSWSPDGRTVAYAVNGQRQIAAIAADGSGHHVIATTTSSDAAFVAWSPDGHSLAFNDGATLIVLDPRNPTGTTAVFRVAQSEIWFPVWSPDSKQIAFNTSDYRLGVIDLARGAVTLFGLPGPAAHPTWHPDATELAYDDGQHIWTVNADGTDPRQVVPQCPAGSACAGQQFEYPHWSPDGLRFAVYVYAGPVAVMNADGSDVRLVVAAGYPYPHPTWSRDGRILFLANHTGTPKPYVMNADTTGLTPVTSGGSYDDMPQWIP